MIMARLEQILVLPGHDHALRPLLAMIMAAQRSLQGTSRGGNEGYDQAGSEVSLEY
jgi:hypothetical protein